ncbi:uncharacterized protein LOC123547251 [Mercenaria mercenaria]|uniref:uncharacterized protein LOC123547251 n=1 Tax=Mercenaria mercenaria TaxID=6596 RepID=UPI00234E9CDD|nr:uncharacterized protein LOC123547251 [Mercenaria mercenaria]XP_045190139.2 uncharacterized protein LOC123547251 [Mercenaria mercenaria]
MILSILFVATCSHAAVQHPHKDLPGEVARRFLHELCPEINTCYGNQTSHGTPVFEKKKNSCCTDCSCDPNCEDNRNCCFPSDPSSKPDDIHSESVCLFPLLLEPKGKDRRFYQSYWMISDVPGDNNGDRHGATKAKCGDENVAPLGTLLPVFSKKTRKIYKNSVCANAANVTDGKPWDVLLTCKYMGTSPLKKDIATFISNLYLTSLHEDCQLQFTYPGDNADLKSEKCFTNLIKTCSERDFSIPEQLPLSRYLIRQLCTTSGLLSPYRRFDMYANVFCYICNGVTFSKTSLCNNYYVENRGLTDNLVLLLDGIFMSDGDKMASKQQSSPKACHVTQKDKESGLCRKVYCPSGQLRNEKGECVFAVKKWYLTRFEMYLKLSADTLFDVDETFKNSKPGTKEISQLFHKWPNNWYIEAVSKERIQKRMHNVLFVKMIQWSPIRDTKKLLQTIQKLLKLPWTLKASNGPNISMFAELWYITRALHGTALSATNITVPLYDFLYRNISFTAKTLFAVTKLYFCEQVELNASEYELHGIHVLRNKITAQVLFTGEFTTVLSADQGEDVPSEHARVCLKDSGYTRAETLFDTDSSVCNVVNKFFLYCYVIILWILERN